MIITIYDTGQMYQIEIDPDNIPEWLLRAYEVRDVQTTPG